ncbi:hypothetical protein DFJ74DRAFT_683083 [Hyaloraphidium curvatum]|nr:hypothetical protein DFJ74DRAFT_683083 [Hyaloraphidium curvatum]
MLALRRLWAELELSRAVGGRARVRCASVRVALPRFAFVGDWKTPNTDVGLLFDVRVGRLGEADASGRGAPFVREDEVLEALGRTPGRPVPMDCLTSADYWDYWQKARKDQRMLSQAKGAATRSVNLDSDVFEGKYECRNYLRVSTDAIARGGRSRFWPRALWKPAARNWAPHGATEDLAVLGVALPFRLFYPIVHSTYRGVKDRLTSHEEDMKFHPWLWDLALSSLHLALAGKSATPKRTPSLDAFLASASGLNSDGLAVRGLSSAGTHTLSALAACLEPPQSGQLEEPIPAFNALQIRLKDLLSGFCSYKRWLEKDLPPQICGPDITRLATLEPQLGTNLPTVVGTDGNATERRLIAASLPRTVFLDPVLPESCRSAGPIAYILPGLMVQLALACAEAVWITPNSSFSQVIAEMAEDGWCRGRRGRTGMVPALPL